jgi:hypothetical protein
MSDQFVVPTSVEQLAAVIAELMRDIRSLREEVSELRNGPAPVAWPPPAGFVSLKDAAAETRRSIECIRLWAASGKITGTRRNGRWYVKMSDVLALAKRLDFGVSSPNPRASLKSES